MELSSSKIKKFLIFQEMELPNSNTKKIIIFSQNKAVLIFQETETPKKNSLYFSKCSFLIFQETETLKNVPSSKNKKTLSEKASPSFKEVFSSFFFQTFSSFTTVFRMFLLLIAFFRVPNFAAFLSGSSFLCCCKSECYRYERGIFTLR